MEKVNYFGVSLLSLRTFGIILHQPVQVLHHIILQKGVHLVEVADNPLQSGVIGGSKHLPLPGFKPGFICAIGKADLFDKAIVDLTVVCFNSSLKGAAEFEPFGEFFLRVSQCLSNLNNSLIDLILFFSQINTPAKLNFIKKYAVLQERYILYHLTILTVKHTIISMKLFRSHGLLYE